MIAREEMDMLIAGAVNQVGRAVQGVSGRTMTRSELDEVSVVLSTLARMIADRCVVAPKLPPPPPYRERRHGQLFQPQPTGLIRPVSDEDIERAKK
jgi:hypothetical protein